MTTVDSLSFEASLQELETIVRRLEEGKTTLEDAIKAYERGAALRAHCEKKLQNARLRIDQIVVGENGSLTTQPTDLEL